MITIRLLNTYSSQLKPMLSCETKEFKRNRFDIMKNYYIPQLKN